MRLKSLDIKGFKSFADKTHIVLDHPITGIVGPNGCGKSNIVDAIRWVIGEHKIKALRSDHLDDLIFNGSRTRSASGLAEVSLTFENTRNLLPTEFSTVTITRKFFKSGDSEYRLNDVSCRLKDIHNLFLDTGVSNDSYAIIELGMVDDIIKDKDGARRRMLEQAAGISIYKTRKKEARQKLDLTEADLARIEDLLFEIAGNVRTLESQAKKAERYFALKGEYKAASIELAKAGLEDFNDRYKSLTDELLREEERKAALDAALSTEEAAVEAEKVALLTKEQELNGLQKSFNETLAQIRALEADVRLGKQRLEHLREREQSGAKNLEQSAVQLSSLEQSVAAAEKNIALETEAVAAAKSQLETLRTDADQKRAAFETHKRALETLRREQQQEQHKRYEAEKRAAVADTSVLNLQRALQQLEDEKKHRASQVDTIATDRAKAEETLGQKQTSLEELTRRQEEVKAKILSSGEELEGLRAKLVEENRALDSRRNEHNLLKSLVDSLEGYPDSIKFLAKHKEWNVGAPLLSDVFVVKPEFRTAIESVLEPYLNHYVVSDIAEAAAAIRLLEGAKKGKASFLLLDHIASGGPNPGPSPEGKGDDGLQNSVSDDIDESWNEVHGLQTADKLAYRKLKEFVKENRSVPTRAERLLWEALRGDKLGAQFRRQHVLGKYIADFVSLDSRLVVEVDGLIHQLPENIEADAVRTDWFNSIGFRVIRFTNEEVLDALPGVLSRIRQALSEQHSLKTSQHTPDEARTVTPPPSGEGSGMGAGTPALDAIEVESKYAALANHLLGNVLVFDILPETAYEDGHILVEKSGRAKTGNAAISGGSVGAFEGNKIGRAKNLERLAKEITERTEVTQGLKSAVADLQQRIAGFNAALADRTLETTRREVIELQNRIGSLGHRIEHFEQLEAAAAARATQLETQLAEATDAITAMRGELGHATEQLDLFRERIQVADVDARTVETAFNKAVQQYNAHNLDATRQQSRLDNLKQEHRFRAQQIEDLRRAIATTEQGIATAATDIAQTAESLAGLEKGLLEGLRKKESEERTLNETDRAYYASRSALQQRESGLGGTRREREAADVLLASIREKLSEMKLRLAGLKERLQVEFKVVLEEILDDPRKGELSVPELEAETERLKKRLENLGEVNPTAVEAFTEMKARHDFIAEQKADLVSAKDSLLATIEEVENTANTRFRETFDAVRENFTKVFKALFTEDDNADLRLTDETDMAETGIEIYAQPKGKKPSTLTQLSGGEKTLTSTAFLFAIYLIKPAPFCILDEVDAPLDDANVGKFTNMIRQFSDRSQFIIVTHNKQTMAAVDVIYGVTMQEPGVSKLVPVDFRSLN